MSDVWDLVYNVEVAGDSSFTVEGSRATARFHEQRGTWRVDDIHNGDIALVGFSEAGKDEGRAHVALEPDEAEKLGRALIEAAKFARRQEDGR